MTTRCRAIAQIVAELLAMPPGVSRIVAECCDHVSIHFDETKQTCSWNGPLSCGQFTKLPRKLPSRDKCRERSALNLFLHIKPELGWNKPLQRVHTLQQCGLRFNPLVSFKDDVTTIAWGTSLQALLAVVRCMQPHKHPELQYRQRHHVKHISLTDYLRSSKNVGVSDSRTTVENARELVADCKRHDARFADRPMRIVSMLEDVARYNFALAYADRVLDWQDELEYVAKLANAQLGDESLGVFKSYHRDMCYRDMPRMSEVQQQGASALATQPWWRCMLCETYLAELPVDIGACNCQKKSTCVHRVCSTQCRDLINAIYHCLS